MMLQNVRKPLDKNDAFWYNIKAVRQGLAEELIRGVAQFGRVLALGARCRRFESCRLDQTFSKKLKKVLDKQKQM